MASIAFDRLRTFLIEQMRMSHVYQPVMLSVLLERDGRASLRDIAAAFLVHDESQLDYYEMITKRMPGPVLQSHNLVERTGDGYALSNEFSVLSATERAELVRLCNESVEAYKAKRGAANKGAGDATDFREVRAGHEARDSSCPFCATSAGTVVAENPLALVIRDRYPVTPLHSLVISRRHVADYFELYDSEVWALHRLIQQARTDIQREDRTVVAFNVGVNSGAVAGQTVPHCHVHLIPRRTGDVENPRGGVRGTISGMADYGR